MKHFNLLPSSNKKYSMPATEADVIPLQQYGQSRSLSVPSLDEDSASDYDYMPEDGLLRDHAKSQRSLRASLEQGFLGNFLLRTPIGQRVHVLLLMIILVALESATVVTNRLIWMTGVWRFPYPITITLGQVLATHVLLMVSAPLTRIVLRRPLEHIGLPRLIAPPARHKLSASSLLSLGLVEHNRADMLRVLPLAIIFVGKLIFSNFAFAYSPFSKYAVTKLPILPLIMLLTPVILGLKSAYSKPLIMTSLLSLAGLLLICLHQRAPAAPTDTLVMGLISSLFSAVYPLVFLRLRDTSLTTILERSIDYYNNDISDRARNRLYAILTHLAPLATLLLLPIFALSGELPDIQRNCYILDVFKFWIPVIGGMFSSFGTFIVTALLLDAAGPIALAVVGILRAGILVLKLQGGGAGVLGWMTWVTGVTGATVCLIGPRRWT